MKSFLVTLLFLANVLAFSTGLEVPTDTTTALQNPDTTLPKLNATVAGNNVLVTRSNIIFIGDQTKKGVVDFIKNMVMRGSSPQDDDSLSTQIIAVLGGDNNTATNSDLATKMMPKIKSAFQSRGKPAQLRQIIVKLTEMSSKFGTAEADGDDA